MEEVEAEEADEDRVATTYRQRPPPVRAEVPAIQGGGRKRSRDVLRSAGADDHSTTTSSPTAGRRR